MRGRGFEPLDHRETLPARFARRTATPVVSFAPAGRSRDLYRSGFRVRRGRIAICFTTHGIYAREERPREGVFRTAEQCEGGDLNPWTSTGADLESAAVSRLGYPRTRARIPHRPRPHNRSRHTSRSRTEGIGSSAFAILNSSGSRSRTRLPRGWGTERETVSRPAPRTGVAFRAALARSV